MNSRKLHEIAEALIENGQTVSCAESCTGGMLAAALTDLPGSSQWFEQSMVTYSNRAKQDRLGVSADTLSRYGAVSRETVEEMAVGARRLSGADFAVGISGIAGPTGGSADKPVGTVWFGLASAAGVFSKTMRFDGNRAEVRRQAVGFALDFLAEHVCVKQL